MPKKKIESKNSQKLDIEINKAVAALSYIWILFLIPLLLKRNSDFAQFHAKQGLVLFILSFLTIIPIIGWFFSLVLIVICLVSIMKTLNGEWFEVPLVYEWSKKFNL